MEWPASISACRPLGRNKFFRGGPNISEKFIPGGTNLRGVQIKRDTPVLLRLLISGCGILIDICIGIG